MSLANLIMANNQQNANYGIQMANDLSAFGQNVVKGMKDKRDMGTAQSMLPVMQQAMKSFGEGKSAEGYSTLLTLSAADPSNPYLDKLIKVGLIGGQAVDDNRYKMAMADAAKARVSAGKPSGPSGSERLRGGTGIPALTNGYTGQGDVITVGTDLATQQRQADLAEEYPDEAEYMSNPDVQAEQDLKGLQQSKVDFNQVPPEAPKEKLSEQQENMRPQIRNFRTLTPADQQQVLSSATTTQKPEGYEARSITGLSELFPNLTGDMLIPEVGTKTTIKRTVSTSDKPGSQINESFAEEKIKVGEKLYDFNSQSAENIPAAVNAMTKQAPADSKKTFVKLFNENGGIENAVIKPTLDPKVYKLFFNGNDKDEYTISDTQANNLSIAQSIPALAGSGVQFLGAKPKAKEDSAADAIRSKFGKTTKDSTKIPPPPERKSAKTKAIDEELTKLKEKELVATAGKRKERIAEIDKEIDKLAQTSTRPAPSTAMYPTRREAISYKGQSDLQASRKRILELEEEKEKLIKGK